MKTFKGSCGEILWERTEALCPYVSAEDGWLFCGWDCKCGPYTCRRMGICLLSGCLEGSHFRQIWRVLLEYLSEANEGLISWWWHVWSQLLERQRQKDPLSSGVPAERASCQLGSPWSLASRWCPPGSRWPPCCLRRGEPAHTGNRAGQNSQANHLWEHACDSSLRSSLGNTVRPFL